MGSKRKVEPSKEDTIKVLTPETEAVAENLELGAEVEHAAEVAETAPAKKAKVGRIRSKKYQAIRAQVDKTRAYDTFAAVELIKKLSYSKFAGTVTADALLREEGVQISLTFPHSTGRTIRAAVVDEALLKQIEAGQFDFDVLITEPRFMPQLAKFAKVLGPKGLMPNPKNGTVTANPELKKKELEGGKLMLKGEKKAPLMHVSIGKTDMDTKDLVENLQALMGALKGKLLKLSVSATMSPGIRVVVE